jgi:hypothetical protein
MIKLRAKEQKKKNVMTHCSIEKGVNASLKSLMSPGSDVAMHDGY